MLSERSFDKSLERGRQIARRFHMSRGSHPIGPARYGSSLLMTGNRQRFDRVRWDGFGVGGDS